MKNLSSDINSADRNPSVICIGAGPAGLTAAYLLSQQNIPVTVLEADPKYVGGIARTVSYKGFGFDIGGHRFFSKSKEVEALWSELLPNDFLTRPRLSRIFYRGKFFSYPLKPVEAFFQLGPLESLLCILSYFKAKLLPIRSTKSFEDWVSNAFGKRLFSIFFKTYTEKVWGMSCKEISADWAAQRIKGLSLLSVFWNAIRPKRKQKEVIKTLINSFRYPRKGPGMMWEAAAKKIVEQQGSVILAARVTNLEYQDKLWKISYQNNQGEKQTLSCTEVLSSVPIKELVHSLSPQPSQACRTAANSLGYRDFLIVALVLHDRNLFPDNWLYIHDSSVNVGRIQNFKQWSPELVPDPTLSCYGLEYFCSVGDRLWEQSDEDLKKLAISELVKLGLAAEKDILDGCVVRQKAAYPVYDEHYQQHVETIRAELAQNFPSLHLVGRNGMHKYNNQDHAMMTAMLTVENIIAGEMLYDVWAVNQDAEYQEQGVAGAKNANLGLRLVPRKIPSKTPGKEEQPEQEKIAWNL